MSFIHSLTRRLFNPVRPLLAEVEKINSRESWAQNLSDAGLSEATKKLRERLSAGETLDDLLPDAFALIREAARRTLGQRHFDVQLLGGIILHRGQVAQMATGEGKTLASTAPVYLNALTGRGAHVVTVNEYLARRDAVWMGQIYYALGLSIGCLAADNRAFLYDPDFSPAADDRDRDLTGSFKVDMEFLRPVSRSEAYAADITYGTNHEFGFDYLRDNLAQNPESQVERPPHFAVIDEVDSILIDEARTPLIISAPDVESSRWYRDFSRLVSGLTADRDYTVDEKLRSVAITDEGIERIERAIGVNNIYAPDNLRLVHYLEESLRAHIIFRRDKDYVVRDGAIVIVDEFTGRLMLGRRYSGGLHQAIEAKEGVVIKEESRTYAKISIQNYFKMYPKLSGMTGTALTSAEEFGQVYGMEVVVIPPNRPNARVDLPDRVYRDADAKMRAVVARVKESHASGQPVLIGTTSIAKNEAVSAVLSRAGLPHEILNAKNHEREGAIIAQAGRPGAITVATNMAGRGVDIILGGAPFDKEKYEQVLAAGGLLVLGTERHEARRIDDQLRGRSGRQGDPGAGVFYLALDDDLLRIFGGERIQRLLTKFNFPEDEPIEMGIVSRSVRQAQEKIEGLHFDSRKHLLEYDDVLNKQRGSAYRYRQELLTLPDSAVLDLLRDELTTHIAAFSANLSSRPVSAAETDELAKLLIAAKVITDEEITSFRATLATGQPSLADFFSSVLDRRLASLAGNPHLKNRLLGIFDMLWMNQLEDMEALAESVRLRAYGQHDPLVEYRKEGHTLFERLFVNFRAWLFENIFRLSLQDSGEGDNKSSSPIPSPTHSHPAQFSGVGRNDPCPCGSGKKYKKCHGQ